MRKLVLEDDHHVDIVATCWDGVRELNLIFNFPGRSREIRLNLGEATKLKDFINQLCEEHSKPAKCVEPQGSLEDRVVGLGKSVVEARNLVKRLVSEATSAKDYAKLVRGQHGQAFLKNFYTDHAFERLLASLNISLHHLDEVLGDGK